jgi:hypothetical protein
MKTNTTLSRRRRLVSVPAAAAAMTPAAATALGGAPASATGLPGDDDELIALGLELDGCYAEFARIDATPNDDTDDAMAAANDHALPHS